MDDAFVSDVSDTAAKNGTNIIVRDEVKIETVIIILWVAGGVLLLTLLILLVCILRNNKKTGAQCGTGQVFLPCKALLSIFDLNSKYTYHKCYPYDGNLMKYISARKRKNCAKSDIFAVLILTNNDKSLSRNPHLYEQVTHVTDRSKTCQSQGRAIESWVFQLRRDLDVDTHNPRNGRRLLEVNRVRYPLQ